MKPLSRIYIVLCVFMYGSYLYGQCSGCTVTNPTISGTYTFTSGSVVCFTSNATLNDVIFEDNSKICVAPGVTVVIQNNVNNSLGTKITLEIGGVLEFGQTPTFNSDIDINVTPSGVLKSGNLGNNNIVFNGNMTGISNRGEISVGVLTFNNSSSNNLIDNHGTMNISSNVNITGNTVFVNDNVLNIDGNYNNTSGSKYINCGIMNSNGGFNFGGGIAVNTGTFNISGGTVDFSTNSKFYNYGVVNSNDNINSASSALIYNEGLLKIYDFQGDAKIEGPATGTNKLGYVEVTGGNRLTLNNNIIGPNLDFTFTQGTIDGGDGRPTSTKPGSGENGTNIPTNRQWIFQTMNGVYQEVNTISFDCRTQGNCSAPLVTNINVCATTRGIIPPDAVDDSFTINAGNGSTQSVLYNDTMVGSPATNLNVVTFQQSTSNSGVTLDTSTGLVQVAPGTPSGIYTLVYSICDILDATNCDNATVSVTVNNSVFIDVKDDIHQTVKGVSAYGSLFYNDYLGSNPNVIAAQHYDSVGALVSLPVGSSTPVYDSSGKLAGQVRINQDGSYEYAPATNYTGTLYLTYTAQDSSLVSGEAGITIKVLDVYNGSNNSPVAQVDASSTSINTTINSTVLANDSDVDGDALNVNSSSITLGSAVPIQGIDLTGAQVNAGSLTLNSNGSYSYIPATDFVGYTLPVPYTISDGKGGEDSAYIRISVFPNTSPYYYTTDDAKAGGRGVIINGDITLNDFVNGVTSLQVDSAYFNGISITIGAPFSISNVGVFTINADGTYVFAPNASYFGNQRIEISLRDSIGNSYNSTLYLTTLVGPFVDVKDDIHQTIKGVSVNGSLLYNDYFGGNSTVTGVQAYDSSGVLFNLTLGVDSVVYDSQQKLAGKITINADGGYSYTPDVNYVGTLSLKYTANDDNLGVGTAGLTIKVLENYKIVNNPPVAQNDASSTTENTTINSTVLPNDSDVDGDPLSLLSSDITLGAATTIKGYDLTGVEVNAGTLTLNSDGSYEFVPVLNFQGITKAVNYTLQDGRGGADIVYLIISVYPSVFSANYYLTDDAKAGKQNNSISGNIKDNDFQNGVIGIVLEEAYESGNTLNVNGSNTISGAGQLTLNTDGSYQFIPTPTFSGTVRVELRTKDTNGNTRNSTLYLTVLPSFVCYKPGIVAAGELQSRVGITSLERAVIGTGNWPMIRKGGWLVLESKAMGFVINRIETTVQVNAIPNPVEGMMVYDKEADCLKINIDGTSSGWKCFNTQTCPD